MPWRGAQYPGDFPSLGWELIDLFRELFIVPAGPLYGHPLELTDEQARFLVRWYGVGPVTGEFAYRRGAYRRIKGTGKSPFGGAIALGELALPVVFDGWNADGEPVGRPWPTPWVQLGATADDQTENTYAPMYEMALHAADPLRLDVQKSKILTVDHPGLIEKVTSEAGTREGQPITYASIDESQLLKPRNGGVAFVATLRRNAAKGDGRSIEFMNAHVPGENSVAEATEAAARAGAAGLLYDSLELPANRVPDVEVYRYGTEQESAAVELELREVITVLRGDSRWVPVERFLDEIADPDTRVEDAYRFYLNVAKRGSERLLDIGTWILRAQGAPSGPPPAGSKIAVGFDGSKNRDCTALYGWWLDTPSGRRHGWLIDVWRRPHDAPADWRVPRKAVHERVRDTFGSYRVMAMACDPPGWENDIDDWVEEFGEQRVLIFDTKQPSKMGPATSRFVTAMAEGDFTQDGDLVVAEHIANCGRGERAGYEVPVKLNDEEKIDVAVAVIVGNWAAETVEDIDEDSAAQRFLDAMSWLCDCEYRNGLTVAVCGACGQKRADQMA